VNAAASTDHQNGSSTSINEIKPYPRGFGRRDTKCVRRCACRSLPSLPVFRPFPSSFPSRLPVPCSYPPATPPSLALQAHLRPHGAAHPPAADVHSRQAEEERTLQLDGHHGGRGYGHLLASFGQHLERTEDTV